MMEKNWKIIETLANDQSPKTLRDLLQKQWLLPRRFVYYLRTRHNVLVNGQYYPVNHQVQPADRSSPKCWCKLNSANLSFHKLKHTGFF